jgi:hypothetical protein
MKARWAAEERAHRAEVAAKLEKNKVIGEELQAFNIQNQAELADIKSRDEAFDLQLIEEAMRAAGMPEPEIEAILQAARLERRAAGATDADGGTEVLRGGDWCSRCLRQPTCPVAEPRYGDVPRP